VGDHAVRHAGLADLAGQGAGVDARQADHVATLHPAVEVTVGAPVGLGGRGVAEDRAAGGRLGAAGHLLQVLDVRAHIAHVREGEGDDLGHVGGVGQDLLIAGHGGVEAHLADRIAGRAATDALQDRAVGQGQNAGNAGEKVLGHLGSASRNAGPE
jgi:hypothetical protein